MNTGSHGGDPPADGSATKSLGSSTWPNPTTLCRNTRDPSPPVLEDNPYCQQLTPAPWLWHQTGYRPAYANNFGSSPVLAYPSVPTLSELPWFHESAQAIKPGHIALSDLELIPVSHDYEDLSPIVNWCDSTDSITYLNSNSPLTISATADDSSLTSVLENLPGSHSCEASKETENSSPYGRMDPARRWLHDHPFDRYPTVEQKTELAATAGMTILQLSRRLTNLRKRDRKVLDKLCAESTGVVEASGASQYHGPLEKTDGTGRKGKRRCPSRPSPNTTEGSMGHPLEPSSDTTRDTANRYHCTVCQKSFKNPYSWKRHEAGVHHFGSTRWVCLLNDAAIMPDMKCIFCSDTVHDMNHFDQHNIHICLKKDKSARGFNRKDGLKQHVQGVHLSSANDYTKKGFEPPDMWSETEDGFSPNPDGLWCGFCKCSFATTAVRMDHVAQHFRDGFQIGAWVQKPKQ